MTSDISSQLPLLTFLTTHSFVLLKLIIMIIIIQAAIIIVIIIVLSYYKAVTLEKTVLKH